MDKVIAELQFNHKLADTVEFFLNKFKQVQFSQSTLQQYMNDIHNILKCNSIKELNHYKNLNENKIYHECVVLEI